MEPKTTRTQKGEGQPTWVDRAPTQTGANLQPYLPAIICRLLRKCPQKKLREWLLIALSTCLIC